jgi:hypothetical protein
LQRPSGPVDVRCNGQCNPLAENETVVEGRHERLFMIVRSSGAKVINGCAGRSTRAPKSIDFVDQLPLSVVGKAAPPCARNVLAGQRGAARQLRLNGDERSGWGRKVTFSQPAVEIVLDQDLGDLFVIPGKAFGRACASRSSNCGTARRSSST